MLRLGAGGKRKNILSNDQTFEISTAVVPSIETEHEKLEDELFGDIEDKFQKKERSNQIGKYWQNIRNYYHILQLCNYF